MNNSMYFSIAKNNLVKNKSTYFPYIIACVGAIMMFYILDCMALNEGLNSIRGAGALKMLFSMAVKVIGLFSVVFLFYTNSFLIKRRKKEIGIYNVLGMEKKHIAKVLTIEICLVSVISLVLGIVFGILLGKVLFLVLLNLLKMDIAIKSSFSISFQAITNTMIMFLAIFFVTLIWNIIQVKMNNPIELLRGGEKGEKEPKASFISTICAIVFLGAGYVMAVTIDKPLKALSTVFICVILVIGGTYYLFTSGSIFILKLLKKNNNFYYKSKNFISVSGMIYRMKQNAVGLASICILSTAVLLTVSTTISLYMGQEDSLKIAHPQDMSISLDGKNNDINKLTKTLDLKSKESNVKIKDVLKFSTNEIMVYGEKDSFEIVKDRSTVNMSKLSAVKFYSLDDYNKIEDKNITLNDNEVLIFSVGEDLPYSSLNIEGEIFNIKNTLDKLKVENKNENNITEEYIIITNNKSALKRIYNKAQKQGALFSHYNINFNLDGEKEDILKFCNILNKEIKTDNTNVESIYLDREDFYTINGAFIFIGIFLGLLFTLGMVLIIYYKQISEGYDDSNRFKIMKKVGMSKSEIKGVINKQILMVFFFPLILALIHIAFAFKPISKLLGLFGLFNINIFLISIVITSLVFVVLYGAVYFMTSKVYYKIVNQ